MAQQYTKYQVGDTIEFPNATKKRPENFAKIVGIETNLQGFPTHYQTKCTHTTVYPDNRIRERFPVGDIDNHNQTKLVTELPAGADGPTGGPSAEQQLLRRRRRRGGKSGKTRKTRKLRKTRRNKRKRRI